jgi:hypothetical protein
MRTERQILGDRGEAFVAECLEAAGFGVKLIGGNFPGYDILATRPTDGAVIRVQVKAWSEAVNEKPLAKAHRLHLADVYVLIRADAADDLRAYVYLADEIATAQRNADTAADFPFARDPGTRNPGVAGFWARRDWRFCKPERLNAWHLVRPCPIAPIAPLPDRRASARPATASVATTPRSSREEREIRNGVRAPMPGGLCDRAWQACADLHAQLGRVPRRAEAVAHGASSGLNPGNVATEYGYWRRFYGLGVPSRG